MRQGFKLQRQRAQRQSGVQYKLFLIVPFLSSEEQCKPNGCVSASLGVIPIRPWPQVSRLAWDDSWDDMEPSWISEEGEGSESTRHSLSALELACNSEAVLSRLPQREQFSAWRESAGGGRVALSSS